MQYSVMGPIQSDIPANYFEMTLMRGKLVTINLLNERDISCAVITGSNPDLTARLPSSFTTHFHIPLTFSCTRLQIGHLLLLPHTWFNCPIHASSFLFDFGCFRTTWPRGACSEVQNDIPLVVHIYAWCCRSLYAVYVCSISTELSICGRW